MAPESLIADRYRVLDELGRGGMGLVYRARDERLGREVALKTVPAAADEAGGRDRLWREARAAASLSHPNICQLYDLVEHDGELFLAMELLAGEQLEQRLARGAMALDDALTIADGILAALGALHSRGIVHRDLKPSNVFLTPHGVKVLDFGLALPLAGDELRLTRPGTLLGTPRYMAPEQWRAGEVTPATDLFVCGALLFEMLSGRPAFPGESLGDLCQAVLAREPPALAGGPRVEAVDRVLRRALAKEPGDRWESAQAMAGALREARGDSVSDFASGRTETLRAQAVTRLVVLPFRLLRPDPEIDFLSYGLADGLTVALGGMPQLVVRSNLSAGRLDDGAPDLAALGRKVDVDAVLHGTLLRAGDRVRLQTQLVQVPSGTVLATNTAQSTLADIFALQDDLTHAVVSALSLTLSPRDEGLIAEAVPSTGRAYELFLRGNDIRAGAGSTSQLIAARDLYKSAVMEDPEFAPAWACLGRVYRVMGKFGHDDADECRKRAEEAFAKALALAPHLPLTHHLYTYLQLEEPGGGVRAMERLLGEIAGGARDPQLYGGLVAACRMGGLLDASLAAHREARRLDGQIRTSVHYTYLALGDYGRAIAHDEDEIPGVRWMAIAELGNVEEAIAGLREIETHSQRGHESYWITSLRASLEGDRAGVLHGIKHSAAPSFRDPEGLYINARPAGFIREPELAMPMLTRAATGFWVVERWETDRAWASFRHDPRFQTLLEQVRAGHQHARERFLAADGERLLGVTLG